MKLSCTQENLNKGLSIVGKTAKPQATLPVLSNILIKTEKGRLKLSSTDLEIGAICFIGAKIDKEGAITIPAKLLIDYVMMNTDEKINLEVVKNTLFLKSAKYEAKIKGIPASEFPLIPEIKNKPSISFSPNKFNEAINQVLIAPSYDETKPALSGICLKILKKEARFVATDSFRLAEKKITLEQEQKEQTIIIPSKTMSEVFRIINLISPSSVTLSLTTNQVLFSFDDVQIVSRLIEGNFPDYEAIIPKTTETEITLDVAEFQNTLKMANLFAKESGSNVKLKINQNKLEISANSPLLGENISHLAAQTTGPAAEITFNAKFILDALNVINTTKITLGVTGKLNPGIIKPFGQKDYLYLIMPLQTEQ